MTRHLRRAAWLLVVLILLGVLVWTGANLVGSWRYQSALADLEADGFVTQPDRIAPAPAPAAENGAPFYSAAFALYVDADGAPWRKLRERTPVERAAADAWLRSNADAFDLVRRAQKRPRCQFERDYRLGYSLPLPELSKVIALSRAFRTLAESQLLAGDGAAARESVKLIFALGECLREDAILVSQLIRFVAFEEALAVLDLAVTEATVDAELREWQALLPADACFKGSLERAYRGEIAMTSALLDGSYHELFRVMDGGNELLWDLLRPLVRYDGADYMTDMRRIILASRKPYLEAAAELTSFDAAQRGSIWRPLRSYVMPALGRSLQRSAAVEARMIVVRAGLGAELARRTSGAYPKSVSGIDPFSGKPLVYDLEKGRIASVRPTEGPEDKPTEWRLRATK